MSVMPEADRLSSCGSGRSGPPDTTPHYSVTSFLDILICSPPETHGLLDFAFESLSG